MRILTFSKAAWDETNSVGNTFSNWFSSWEPHAFFHITTRPQPPRNRVCNTSFVLSEPDLLRGLLTRKEVGRLSSGAKPESASKPGPGWQGRLLHFLHRHPLSLVYAVSDWLWQTGVWRGKRFEDYVSQASPDIFFAFLDDFYMLLPLVRYLKKNTKARMVFFIADDVFSRRGKGPLHRLLGRRNRGLFRQLLMMADLLYGASPMLCEEYARNFGVSIQPLYKGCAFSGGVYEAVRHPLNITYAGNLHYGREQALKEVVDALKSLGPGSDGQPPVTLNIYTPTELRARDRARLEVPGLSRLHPARPYDEIVRILADCDLVLHVESGDPAEVRKTRLSFSTKIIDALQSGAALAALGPDGIASMAYIRGIDGAFAARNGAELAAFLQGLHHNPSALVERKHVIRAFAERHHAQAVVRSRLQQDFGKLIGQSQDEEGVAP